MISGQASRGMTFRCFQSRTDPGERLTRSAKAAGPPWLVISEAAFSAMGTDVTDSNARFQALNYTP